MRQSRFTRWLLILPIVAFASLGFAQSDTGRITGTITDSSGAVVSGATINVTNIGKQRTVTVQSGGAGEYSVPSLAPGDYKIEVTSPNFKNETQMATLQVQQALTLNFTLSAGSTTETVQVSGAAPVLSTDQSDIGDVITGRQIVELPLNTRDFTQLAELTPGVSRGMNINGNSTGTQGNAETYRYSTVGGAALVVNGLRPQANNFLLDGFDNNESLVNTIIFFPSPDAIQEFKVQTNVAPAEYGRAGGAIVNTAIRSGTNDIHGTIFEYFRNSALDATPWQPINNATKPLFHQNQFGAAIGGPIIKNKLFFFVDYQGLRTMQPNTPDYVTVPTLLQRNSGFTNFSEISTPIINPATGMAYPGNILPVGQLNPAAVAYLNAFPAPNCSAAINPNCQTLTNNYTTTRQNIYDFNDFDARFDYNIGAKDNAFFRYSYGNDVYTKTSIFQNLPAGFGSGTNPTLPWSAVIEETHLFSSNLVNEARFGFIHTDFGYTPPLDSIPVSANLGIVNANVNAAGQPDPLLGGGALIGGFNTQLEYTGDYGPYDVPQDSWQEADNLSWVKGKHTMKFGANIIRRQVNFFRPITGKGYFDLCGNGTSPATITGYEVTDLLVGFVCSYSEGPVLGYSETRNWELGFYGQDDWKITPRLTVNYGLRWDVLTWPVEKFNNQANFNIATGQLELAGQDGNSRSFIPVSYHNFAPRIGFAYDLSGNGTTKISGGYGIFYFVDRGGISNQLAQNPPFSGEATFNYLNGYRITFTGQGPTGTQNGSMCLTNCSNQGTTIPLPSKGPLVVDLADPTNVSISVATLPTNETPSVQEWNFQFEHQLDSSTVLSLAYVGDKGTHLVTYFNYNRQQYGLAPCSVTSPAGCNFPALGDINTQATIGNSSYNALQINLTRRFIHGFQFGAAYTWSHAIDNSPDAYDSYSGSVVDYRDLAAERASSDYDMRNRLVLSGLYALPFGRGQQFGGNWNSFTDAVLGGWQTNLIFTAQSGTPFDVLCGQENPEVRCDLVGNPSAGVSGLYAFNPAAFAPVPTSSNGTAIGPGTTPRNYLTGPGFTDVDFSVFKNFKFGERVNTQFRAEFFNLFNTPHFVQPDYNFTDGNFGKQTSTLLSSERQIQFALRVSF
jgi:Carboxypeptidase regulatory-like domain/TonB-dependent Receptor Plug Domain